MEKKTTIQLRQSTKDALVSLGKKGDTYDMIIQKLIMQRDITNKWNTFRELDRTSQKEVLMKMHEYNNDYMFSIASDKGYAGLRHAYYNDTNVRNALNTAMKEI